MREAGHEQDRPPAVITQPWGGFPHPQPHRVAQQEIQLPHQAHQLANKTLK
jgi:hypothetical protein